MDFYIFKNTGEYIGIRGQQPNENEIGVEVTAENIEKNRSWFQSDPVSRER